MKAYKTTKKIKVAFVFGALGGGGAQRQFGWLLNKIDKTQFEPIIISIGQSKKDVAKHLAEYPKITNEISVPKSVQHDEFTKYFLYRKLRTRVTKIYFVKRFFAKDIINPNLQVWRILRQENPEIVCCVTPFASLFARVLAPLVGIRQVVWCIRGLGTLELFNKRWFRNFNSFLDRNCTTYIVNSKQLESSLIKIGISVQKVKTIYNGIPIYDKYFTKKAKQNIKKLRVAYIARLSPVKDHKTFLKAISKIDKSIDVVFDIYGTGPCEYDLKKMVKYLKIEDKVGFHGWIQNPFLILPEIDVVCLSSHSEGFNNSIAEAQMHGIPVVTTNANGCSEIVIDGLTGFIVPIKDHLKFAMSLEKLLINEKIRIQFGKAAKKRFREHFTIEKMVEEYEKLFLSLKEKSFNN